MTQRYRRIHRGLSALHMLVPMGIKMWSGDILSEAFPRGLLDFTFYSTFMTHGSEMWRGIARRGVRLGVNCGRNECGECGERLSGDERVG